MPTKSPLSETSGQPSEIAAAAIQASAVLSSRPFFLRFARRSAEMRTVLSSGHAT